MEATLQDDVLGVYCKLAKVYFESQTIFFQTISHQHILTSSLLSCGALTDTMPSSRIVELASIISMRTKLVDEYLSAQGLPPLSFEPTEDSRQYSLPDSIQAAQKEILEATDELHAHMLGPMGILNQQLVCLMMNHQPPPSSDLLINPNLHAA